MNVSPIIKHSRNASEISAMAEALADDIYALTRISSDVLFLFQIIIRHLPYPHQIP